MSATDSGDAQRERAQQAWELVVLDRPTRDELGLLQKILRVKRFELEAFAASLPGRVRCGARIDLLSLEEALRDAGIRCELRRSTAG